MFRKIAVVSFLSLVLYCFFGASASAQQPLNCERFRTAHDLGIDLGAPTPPWARLFSINTTPGLGLLNVYLIMNISCHPPCDCNHQPSGSHPIMLGTGNTWIAETDVSLPGLSNGLQLVRTWNSALQASGGGSQLGIFGPNWRSTYEETVFVGSDYYIKYTRTDGSTWSFGMDDGGIWRPASPANAPATLLPGPSYYTITFQNGERRLFDNTTGHLLSIIDRNNNTTQLSYDSANRLVTVTDPGSRHLTFGYATNTSTLVTSVTSDTGISLSYSYDSSGRLSQVTKPDSSTLNFTYSSQSLITSVTDSNGKVLESHTYDILGRGLTGAKANGVEAVTITYPN